MLRHISEILHGTLPIFAGSFPERVIPITPVLLRPSRIKFCYQPKPVQVLHPGIHFVLPDAVTPRDTLLIDKLLIEGGFKPIKVPDVIYKKFEAASPPRQQHGPFNYLYAKDGSLVTKNSVRCFLHHTCDPEALVETNVFEPSYGVVTDLSTASALLHATLMLVRFSSCFSRIKDDEIDIAVNNLYALKKLYGDTDFSFSYQGPNFRLCVNEFEITDFDNLDCVQNFICAFHDLFLNVNHYMGWDHDNRNK